MVNVTSDILANIPYSLEKEDVPYIVLLRYLTFHIF